MKRKILLVEDDQDIADLVKLVLETADYDVSMVVDPREAYEAAVAGKPDAILLDLLMPQMSGWDVFKKIRANAMFSKIPVAILTAKSEGIDEMVGLHVMKADAYITKPFGKKELVDKVNELFEKKL